jgi:hypothetical protein
VRGVRVKEQHHGERVNGGGMVWRPVAGFSVEGIDGSPHGHHHQPQRVSIVDDSALVISIAIAAYASRSKMAGIVITLAFVAARVPRISLGRTRA